MTQFFFFLLSESCERRTFQMLSSIKWNIWHFLTFYIFKTNKQNYWRFHDILEKLSPVFFKLHDFNKKSKHRHVFLSNINSVKINTLNKYPKWKNARDNFVVWLVEFILINKPNLVYQKSSFIPQQGVTRRPPLSDYNKRLWPFMENLQVCLRK